MVLSFVFVTANIGFVSADTVYIDHQHGSGCIRLICGTPTGVCLIGGDCSAPPDEGGHICKYHEHDSSCYGINCGYQTEKVFKAPETGEYLLEVWGAGGGDAIINCSLPFHYYYGGSGGYAKGTIHLEKDEELRYSVGIKGNNGYGSVAVENGEKNSAHGSMGGSSYIKYGSSVLIEGEGGGGAYRYCHHEPNADGGNNGSSGNGTVYSNLVYDSSKSSGVNSGQGRVKITYTHEHSYSWVTTKEPTCTKKGSKDYVCDCGYVSKTTEIPALGHDKEKDWVYDRVIGYHVKDCKRCGTRLEKEPNTYQIRYDAGLTNNSN